MNISYNGGSIIKARHLTPMNDQKTTLKANALGFAESLIMGIAGSAPAYSVAATTSTMISVAGVFAPGILLLSGFIMLGIAFAFIHLNKIAASAGTSFAWVSMVFGKTAGFFAGWCILVLSCVFMVSATIPAANATLLILNPQLVNNINWVTFTAALWLTFISAVVVKGVKVTSYVQVGMTILEGLIFIPIMIMGVVVFFKEPSHQFSWTWFLPTHFSPHLLASSIMIALFFFFGWDVAMTLSEETRDPQRTPGRAAFWSVIFMIIFFPTFIMITLLGLSDAEIQQSNTNIIFALAEKLFGKTWGYIAIIAVLLSTVGTVETQIVQFTRTLFAKGRAGALHPCYSRLHLTWQTPYIAIFFIWIVGLALLFSSSYLPSVNVILQNSITAIGIQISFYLGLTGFACAWHHRHMMSKRIVPAITHVVWPALSGCILFIITLYSIPSFNLITSIVGFGGIAIGIFPLLWNLKRKNAR